MNRQVLWSSRLTLGGITAFALSLVVPGILAAQMPSGGAESMDAWRARLSERLEQDLAALSAPLPRASQKSFAVKKIRLEDSSLQSLDIAGLSANRDLPLLPGVTAILREHGLPGSLLGVVAVESNFDPVAVSPKGALGLWQLMPETARRYGLRVDSFRDERLDPFKSTFAAARYLRDLYDKFQDWPLVFAAYNAGEDRVERSLASLGARDFWTLKRASALPEETRRYVPTVLAKVKAPSAPLAHQPDWLVFPLQGENGARERLGSARGPAPIVFATPSPAGAGPTNSE